MPKIIKKIDSNILDFIDNTIKFNGNIVAKIGLEPYFELKQIVGIVFDFSKVVYLEDINKNIKFGLKNNDFVNLKISYS